MFGKSLPSIADASTSKLREFSGVAPQEEPQISEELIEEIGEKASEIGININFIDLNIDAFRTFRNKQEIGLLDGYDTNNLFDFQIDAKEDREQLKFNIEPLLNLTKIVVDLNVDIVEDTVDDIDFVQPLESITKPVGRELLYMPFFTKAEDRKQELDENIPIDATEGINLDIFADEIKPTLKNNSDYLLRLGKENILIYDRSVHESAAMFLDIEAAFDEIFLPSMKPLEQMTPIESNVENLVEIDSAGIEKAITSIISPENFAVSAEPFQRFEHVECNENQDELINYSIDLNLDELKLTFDALENIKPVGERNINTLNVEKLVADEIQFDNPFYIIKYYKLIKNFEPREKLEFKLNDDVPYDFNFDFSGLFTPGANEIRFIENIELDTASEERINNVLEEAENISANDVAYDCSFELNELFNNRALSRLDNLAQITVPELKGEEVFDSTMFNDVSFVTYVNEQVKPLNEVTKITLYENIDPQYQQELDLQEFKFNIEALNAYKKAELPYEANEREATEAASTFVVELPQITTTISIYPLYSFSVIDSFTLAYKPPIDDVFENLVNDDVFKHLNNITKVEIPIIELREQVYDGKELAIDIKQQESPLLHLTFKEPLPERDVKASEIGIDDLIRPVIEGIFGFTSNELFNNTMFLEPEDSDAFISDLLDEAFANSIAFCIKQSASNVDETLCRLTPRDENDEDIANDIISSMFNETFDEIISKKVEEKESGEESIVLTMSDIDTILGDALESSVTNALLLEQANKEEEIDISEVSHLLDVAFVDSMKYALTVQEEEHEEEEEKLEERVEEPEKELEENHEMVDAEELFGHELNEFVEDFVKKSVSDHMNVFEAISQIDDNTRTLVDIHEIRESLVNELEKIVVVSIQPNIEAIDSLFNVEPIIAAPKPVIPKIEPTLHPFFASTVDDLVHSFVIQSCQSNIQALSDLSYKSKEKKEKKVVEKKQNEGIDLDELNKSLNDTVRTVSARALFTMIDPNIIESIPVPKEEEQKEPKEPLNKQEQVDANEEQKEDVSIEELEQSVTKAINETIALSVEKALSIELPEQIVVEKKKEEEITFEKEDFANIIENAFETSVSRAVSTIDSVFIPQNEKPEDVQEDEIQFDDEIQFEEEVNEEINESDITPLLETAFKQSITFALSTPQEMFIPFDKEELFEEEEAKEEIKEEIKVQDEKKEEFNLFEPIFSDIIVKSTNEAVEQTLNTCSQLIFNATDGVEVQEKPQKVKQQEVAINELVDSLNNEIKEVTIYSANKNIEAVTSLFETIPEQNEKQTPQFNSDEIIVPFMNDQFNQSINGQSVIAFNENAVSIASMLEEFALLHKEKKNKEQKQKQKPKKENKNKEQKNDSLFEADFDKAINDTVKQTVANTFDIFDEAFGIEDVPQPKQKEEDLDVRKEMDELLQQAFNTTFEFNLQSSVKSINEALFFEEQQDEEADGLFESMFNEILDEIPNKLENEQAKEMINFDNEFDDLLNEAVVSSINAALAVPDIIVPEQEEFEEEEEKAQLNVIGDIEFTSSSEDEEEKKSEEIDVTQEFTKILDNAFNSTFSQFNNSFLDGMIIHSEPAAEKEQSPFDPIFTKAIEFAVKESVEAGLSSVASFIDDFYLLVSDRFPPPREFDLSELSKSFDEEIKKISMLQKFDVQPFVAPEPKPKITFTPEPLMPVFSQLFDNQLTFISANSVFETVKNIEFNQPKLNETDKKKKNSKFNADKLLKTLQKSFTHSINDIVLETIDHVNIPVLLVQEKESNKVNPLEKSLENSIVETSKQSVLSVMDTISSLFQSLAE